MEGFSNADLDREWLMGSSPRADYTEHAAMTLATSAGLQLHNRRHLLDDFGMLVLPGTALPAAATPAQKARNGGFSKTVLRENSHLSDQGSVVLSLVGSVLVIIIKILVSLYPLSQQQQNNC